MEHNIERRPSSAALQMRIVVIGAIAALAAAWLWNRSGEAALHQRTAKRLSPLTGRHGT